MKKALNLAVILLLAAPAAALDVTAVTPAAVKGAAKANFSFGPLTLKNVSWEKGAVVLPVTENKGRKYNDVKLLSKAFYAKLEACFKNGCAPAKAAAPKVKVEKLKPLKSPARVANAEVSLDGDLLVTAGVMASKKEEGAFWVAFPPDVEFTDGAFKGAVESAVIAAWTKKK
ncbi:MAG: hypothetical protein ACYC2I_05225 [Elusimicrobiales bacterium]